MFNLLLLALDVDDEGEHVEQLQKRYIHAKKKKKKVKNYYYW